MGIEKWNELTERCREAMAKSHTSPGRYGGLYVGRRYDRNAKRDVFLILEDDDPETVPNDIDVLAHVYKGKVCPIGHARYWLGEDGTVDFSPLVRRA
jgi:hypothetical protein